MLVYQNEMLKINFCPSDLCPTVSISGSIQPIFPTFVQVGLHFAIFRQNSGSSCFSSTILTILKKPELYFRNSVMATFNVTTLVCYQLLVGPILVPQFITNDPLPGLVTLLNNHTLHYYSDPALLYQIILDFE